MNQAFRQINEGTTLLADAFGNDVTIEENGNAKFREITADIDLSTRHWIRKPGSGF